MEPTKRKTINIKHNFFMIGGELKLIIPFKFTNFFCFHDKHHFYPCQDFARDEASIY